MRTQKEGKKFALRVLTPPNDLPEEPTPECDGTLWEPVGPYYTVHSATGRLLDSFHDKWDAIAALYRWEQASIVCYAGVLAHSKSTGTRRAA